MFFCALRKNISWMAVLHKPVHIHKWSGSHVHFYPRPCSSTCRQANFSTHRHSGPHFVCNPCSCAHFGRVTAACVSSPKRLGCLHWLAHAARHGHFQGASTSRRTASFVFFAFTSENQDTKIMAIVSPETWLSCVVVTTRVFCPAGRTLHSGHQTCTRPCDEHLSMGQACNPPTPREPQHFVCRPCSGVHFGRVTTACVIAKKLGSLHWVARASGHGYEALHWPGARQASRPQQKLIHCVQDVGHEENVHEMVLDKIGRMPTVTRRICAGFFQVPLLRWLLLVTRWTVFLRHLSFRNAFSIFTASSW